MCRPRRIRWLLAACIASTWRGIAAAQQPVCPPPSLDKPSYGLCAPAGRLVAARFLWELTIDHVLKPDVFSRRADDLFRSLAPKTVQENNPQIVAYLAGLEPAMLSRLETSTGALDMAVPDGKRTFASTVEIDEQQYQLSWRLPARIAGGYWRTPAVLQIAFWDGSRMALTLTSPNGTEVSAEIACLALSTDALRVVATDASTPDILVAFVGCE